MNNCVRFPPKTTEVANPERKELSPSSFALTCSIMHSKRTKIPPKVANPLPVPFIFLQSFLNTIAVDLLTLPNYISLISKAFINIDITNPIAPPKAYETAAFPMQFPSRAPKGVDSNLLKFYYKDY